MLTDLGKHKWTEAQKLFLLDSATLVRWASYSIQERVSLARRKFPDVHVTSYKLRKLYHENKVRKKVIRKTKVPDKACQKRIEKAKVLLNQAVLGALRSKRRIV